MSRKQLRHLVARSRRFACFVAVALNLLQCSTGLTDDIEQDLPAFTIARIETFGLRAVSREDVIVASGLRVGDNLENVGGKEVEVDEVVKRIESINGVERASFAAINGRLLEDNAVGLVVYLGIEEPGRPKLEFGQEPTGDSSLPIEVTTAADNAKFAFNKATAKGNFQEDRSMGYSLSEDQDLREAQEAFVPLAEKYWEQLVEVLHESRDASQRAISAQILAYAPDKRQIVQELIPAVRDPDAGVRNNATRALSLLFKYARVHPELAVTAPPELVQTLVKMLNSPEWLDLNKATGLLLNLDEHPVVLQALQVQSVPSLIEMSKWQTDHGKMAFMLLGRLAGLTHEESLKTWDQGNQSSIIYRAEQTTATK